MQEWASCLRLVDVLVEFRAPVLVAVADASRARGELLDARLLGVGDEEVHRCGVVAALSLSVEQPPEPVIRLCALGRGQAGSLRDRVPTGVVAQPPLDLRLPDDLARGLGREDQHGPTAVRLNERTKRLDGLADAG